MPVYATKTSTAGKSRKTLYAYTRTLNTLAAVCPKQYLEVIDRRDVLNYIAHLRRSGNVPRTVANRVDFLHIFFNHRKIAWPLEKTDRIKYTEKTVCSYQSEEIIKLLAAADQEESELLEFFLFTGSRDQEVQYATWRDMDFSAKTFTVTEKSPGGPLLRVMIAASRHVMPGISTSVMGPTST
jgi:site-specific recombinase XerD